MFRRYLLCSRDAALPLFSHIFLNTDGNVAHWSLQAWTKSGKVMPLLKLLRRGSKVTNLVGRLYRII